MEAMNNAPEFGDPLNDNFTIHAYKRMDERGIALGAVQAVLDYGRVVYIRGAVIHAIGRKEVARLAKHDTDVSEYEGIQVVCSHDGKVITVYRNHDFSGLRGRRHRNFAA